MELNKAKTHKNSAIVMKGKENPERTNAFQFVLPLLFLRHTCDLNQLESMYADNT